MASWLRTIAVCAWNFAAFELNRERNEEWRRMKTDERRMTRLYIETCVDHFGKENRRKSLVLFMLCLALSIIVEHKRQFLSSQ